MSIHPVAKRSSGHRAHFVMRCRLCCARSPEGRVVLLPVLSCSSVSVWCERAQRCCAPCRLLHRRQGSSAAIRRRCGAVCAGRSRAARPRRGVVQVAAPAAGEQRSDPAPLRRRAAGRAGLLGHAAMLVTWDRPTCIVRPGSHACAVHGRACAGGPWLPSRRRCDDPGRQRCRCSPGRDAASPHRGVQTPAADRGVRRRGQHLQASLPTGRRRRRAVVEPGDCPARTAATGHRRPVESGSSTGKPHRRSTSARWWKEVAVG